MADGDITIYTIKVKTDDGIENFSWAEGQAQMYAETGIDGCLRIKQKRETVFTEERLSGHLFWKRMERVEERIQNPLTIATYNSWKSVRLLKEKNNG